MGYSLAWVAVQTLDQTALFELARVRPTDEDDEYFEGPISGAALEGDWFLLVGQSAGHRLIEPGLLASISVRWPCVACSVEEHVMFSHAALLRGGEEVWSVAHDAQQGIFHLAASGTLPGSFEDLRRRKFQEQEAEGGEGADVDLIFEVPLLLAQGLTGFKHDEKPTCLIQTTAMAFVDVAPPTRPWWKLW